MSDYLEELTGHQEDMTQIGYIGHVLTPICKMN